MTANLDIQPLQVIDTLNIYGEHSTLVYLCTVVSPCTVVSRNMTDSLDIQPEQSDAL